MKYFIDTEFAEKPCQIDLISLAIVAEDGREFYAESSEFDYSQANEWVKQNVVPQLWHLQADKSKYNAWIRDRGCGGLLSRTEIAREVRLFIGDDKPEFWGYYADYDWVVFCWLFGPMVDLPKGWPMYCRDIKQWADQLGGVQLPQQDTGEHHALADARWNKLAFEYLQTKQESIPSDSPESWDGWVASLYTFYEDEANWCIAPKEFWEIEQNIPDSWLAKVPAGFVECCEHMLESNKSLEEQEQMLRELGFEIVPWPL